MHRRLTVLAALCTGALAAAVALPLISACTRSGASQGSFMASDAHAETAAANTAQDAQKAVPLSALPSLAPLVKQLRPVVVNINSRFKPRASKLAQRLPQGHPRLQQPPQGEGDEGEDDGQQQQQQDPMERFFRYFGQPQQPDNQERRGLGSGFLIGDGLVLTNNHVVEIPDENRQGKYRAMDEIKVITDESAPGGAREFSAKVLGNDPKSDIALLKIEGKDVANLKYASLGDSDAIEVGDYVVAIGEPFGLQATVTTGIISAKERSQFGGPYSDYLQTDASINPGNSGGPLFNLKGEVVGINSAIISGANTIGFAIPIAVVKQILPQLKANGKVVRGYLGVAPQAITADMMEQLGLKSTRGALLADVVKEGPAEKGGLKPGDVIVAVNGKQVADNNQLTRDIGAVQPGQSVKLEVVRNGKQQSFDVRVAPRPDETEEAPGKSRESGGSAEKGDLLGLSVQDLTPELSRRARVEAGTRGAVVTDVTPETPGADAGFEPGDVIVEVNRQPIGAASDYKKAVRGLKKGDTALLRVKHGQATQYVPVQIK